MWIADNWKEYRSNRHFPWGKAGKMGRLPSGPSGPSGDLGHPTHRAQAGKDLNGTLSPQLQRRWRMGIF